MSKCPHCAAALQPILDGENRGVRCSKPLCPFNFEDLACPECGKAVVIAARPSLGAYDVACAAGHTWTVKT